MVKSVKHFRPYLYGRSFKLRADHASLIWLCKRPEPSGQMARCLEVVSEFKYTIEHRAGAKHQNDKVSAEDHVKIANSANGSKREMEDPIWMESSHS